MKKTKTTFAAIIVFVFTLISVYLIVHKNSSKFPDSTMYLYSH
jgi:hypothetical protein